MNVNYDRVCRLCLSSRCELLPIFPTTSSDDSEPPVLASKIKDCVSVQVCNRFNMCHRGDLSESRPLVYVRTRHPPHIMTGNASLGGDVVRRPPFCNVPRLSLAAESWPCRVAERAAGEGRPAS